MRFGEANTCEERYAELERKSSMKPKLQLQHRSHKMTESSTMLEQSEGGVGYE